MIGYWLVQELANAGIRQPVVSVVTQTVVDTADPAFRTPTKFIGPVYDVAEARRLTATHGWRMAADGNRWRRVVPSPRPLRVVEEEPIRDLVEGGTVVICGGGGGVPVQMRDGGLTGIEAVVDKDLTTALLARVLDADRPLLLTDVPAVLRDFSTAQATELRRLTVAEADHLPLPAGSMGPKVAACVDFVRTTGHPRRSARSPTRPGYFAGTAGTMIVASQRSAG
jgi:carbamate kinase